MRKILAVMIMLMAVPVWADTIDDAEAKRRGVPIEQVQLEHERDRNAQLEKQVSDMKNQMQAIQKQLADTKKDAASAHAELDKIRSSTTKPGQTPIDDAIKNHKLAAGMTLDQVKKAVNGSWQLTSGGETGESYECTQYVTTGFTTPSNPMAPQTPIQSPVVVASVFIVNGKVVSFNVDPRYVK